ncbi:unnamed protein product [Cunninghamella blakesleeana]
MMNIQNKRESYRYSWNSCVTEDSTESASLATPLSASPCPQPNTIFPIITVAEEDSYVTSFHIPYIATVVTNRNQQQQQQQQQQQTFSNPTSPEPSGVQIMQHSQPSSLTSVLLPHPHSHHQQNSIRDFEQNGQDHLYHPSSSSPQPSSQSQPSGVFWPRIKRILSNSSLISNHLSESHSRKKIMSHNGFSSKLSQSDIKDAEKKEDDTRKWFDIKKSRIHPF